MVWILVWWYMFEPFIHILQHFVLQPSHSTNFCFYVQLPFYWKILKVRNKHQKYDEGTLASTRYFTITRQFSKRPSLVLVSKRISLHSDLVYTCEQQIFIDEIQVYSRRHIQLSSTRDESGGQPSIFCFVRFHWSVRFSELFFSLFFATHGQSISYREAY